MLFCVLVTRDILDLKIGERQPLAQNLVCPSSIHLIVLHCHSIKNNNMNQASVVDYGMIPVNDGLSDSWRRNPRRHATQRKESLRFLDE
jgi:hypothetical protein